MFIINFKHHTGLQSWQGFQVLWETSLFYCQNGCVPPAKDIVNLWGHVYLGSAILI